MPRYFVYLQGCYDVLWSYVEEYNKYVMTTVIIVSIIQVIIVFYNKYEHTHEIIWRMGYI